MAEIHPKSSYKTAVKGKNSKAKGIVVLIFLKFVNLLNLMCLIVNFLFQISTYCSYE